MKMIVSYYWCTCACFVNEIKMSDEFNVSSTYSFALQLERLWTSWCCHEIDFRWSTVDCTDVLFVCVWNDERNFISLIRYLISWWLISMSPDKCLPSLLSRVCTETSMDETKSPLFHRRETSLIAFHFALFLDRFFFKELHTDINASYIQRRESRHLSQNRSTHSQRWTQHWCNDGSIIENEQRKGWPERICTYSIRRCSFAN